MEHLIEDISIIEGGGSTEQAKNTKDVSHSASKKLYIESYGLPDEFL